MSYHYKDYNLMVDRNLFTAAKCGDIALVRDLLTAGYKPNHRDKYGKTALHHATEGIHVECVKILLSHNAKKGFVDNLNRTPLMVLDDVTKRADSERLNNAREIALLLQ